MGVNAILDLFLANGRPARQGVPAPDDWPDWLLTLFPRYVEHDFADRHIDLWDWAWAIDADASPRPFVGIWPRGGGKSTTAELASCAMGLRGTRRYLLYIRETQELADKSVANIAALLESDTVARYYPSHADRAVSKFGTSKGWRRNRLRTAGGFTVDAIGLDTAARGVKVDDQRPDLIILDDIDGKNDTAAATVKKTNTITTSLLPAGSSNCAVLAIQNLIIPDGVFSQLTDGRADYLAKRIVSGPYPAIENLETEWEEDAVAGTRRAVITHGTATWPGQNLATCQDLLDRIGLEAFLAECQHDVSARKEGIALKFTEENYADLTDDDVKALVALGRVWGGLDFGAWRFGATINAADRHGVITTVFEYFSQREELGVRAAFLDAECKKLGVERMLFWGDAANPQDIMELNAAWARMQSKLRCVPVAMENKMRAASVTRLNEVLKTRALRVRRSIGAGRTWRLGWNASSKGTDTQGSRLLWEIKNWSYPIPQDGKAQGQDPDDNTADGADCIASWRYGLMSHLKPAKQAPPPDPDLVLGNVQTQTLGSVKRAMKQRNKTLLRRLGGL